MIVATLTSWTKRINNVKPVVESLMKNSIQPDVVYLNLSETEFKGIDLPKDLVRYFNSDDRLIINWIPGENTKTMKKVFPILQYLDDEDIIINLDDDSIIPPDAIESRLNEFNKYNQPITSCNNPRFHYIDAKYRIWSCGPFSIFRKKHLKNWEKFVDDSVIRTYNDDWIYSIILWMNGYRFRPCSDYSRHSGLCRRRLQKFNDVEPSLKNKVYLNGRQMHDFIAKRCNELYGRGTDYMKYFNINDMKQEEKHTDAKHDVILLYTENGVHSKAITIYEHPEVEYVLASLNKFCKSWINRIFLVGDKPSIDLKKYNVTYVPCGDPFETKWDNMNNKFMTVINNYPDLTKDWLFVSDDQIVTRETTWNDIKPMYSHKFTKEEIDDIVNNRKFQRIKKNEKDVQWQTLYNDFWIDTLNEFIGRDDIYRPEAHIWMKYNTDMFVNMINTYKPKRNVPLSSIIYYNSNKIKMVALSNHLYVNSSNDVNVIKFLQKYKSNKQRFVSWYFDAFNNKKFRDFLDELVGFKKSPEKKAAPAKEKPKESKPSSNSKIEQLRKDIMEGKVIRVPYGTGFIWKRVTE